ncbi:hypothetical protein T09_9467 [Trichinella sp. T9]|nr:hypothetical protein T09_9467 [Trichinella sp. T9]
MKDQYRQSCVLENWLNGLCYKNNLKTYSFTDSQYNIDESVISTRPHKFMVLKLSYLKVSFVSKPKYSKLQTEDRKLINFMTYDKNFIIRILAHYIAIKSSVHYICYHLPVNLYIIILLLLADILLYMRTYYFKRASSTTLTMNSNLRTNQTIVSSLIRQKEELFHNKKEEFYFTKICQENFLAQFTCILIIAMLSSDACL